VLAVCEGKATCEQETDRAGRGSDARTSVKGVVVHLVGREGRWPGATVGGDLSSSVSPTLTRHRS